MLDGFRFHHVGYAVRDIEQTASVYRQLGYTQSPIVCDEAQNVYICFMKRDGFPLIELIEAHDETSPMVRILQNNGVAPYHCCYEVENLESAIRELRAMRFMPTTSEVVAPAIGGGIRVIFMYNTNVGLIELAGK